MKTPHSFSATMLGLCAILVLVSAVGIRLATPRVAPAAEQEGASTTGSATETVVGTTASTVPDLTSAAYPDGDALKGLGADWTFVSQRTITEKSAAALPGTNATRESVIKIVGKETQLLLIESDIADQKKLDVALKAKNVKKLTIAKRNGYVVPANGIAGGTGFLLVGKNTTLLLQDSASAVWPKSLEPEILSYIATVNVR